LAIADVLSTAEIILDLSVATRRSLLETLSADAADRLGWPRQDVLEPVEAREQLGSTALRDGIAFPHAQIAGLPHPFMLFARLRQPIYFDPADDEPVDLIFLMLWPADDTKGFLPAMAEICRALREPKLLRRLRAAASAAEVLELLKGVRNLGADGPGRG
jgi:PTS system nitrogen regulatory IIA component